VVEVLLALPLRLPTTARQPLPAPALSAVPLLLEVELEVTAAALTARQEALPEAAVEVAELALPAVQERQG